MKRVVLSVVTCMLLDSSAMAASSTSSLNSTNKTDLSNLLKVLNQSQTASSYPKKSSLLIQSDLLGTSQLKSNSQSNSNVLHHLTAVASNTVSNFKQAGLASWYGKNQNGHKTASGETFNMNAMTAAHDTLKLGSFVKVTNKDNGKSVIVKINDRNGTAGKSMLDLSYGAAQKIGLANQTLGKVIIEKIR